MEGLSEALADQTAQEILGHAPLNPRYIPYVYCANAIRYNVLPTHRHTQLSFNTTGRRKSCARYSVRYKGKKAFVCTSNA